jgi:hypothetical protein
LIRIGTESRVTWATKRASGAFGGMAAILLFVWLFRGDIGIASYSSDIILVSLSLIFLSLVFNTKTNSGLARTLSSLLGNLAGASIIAILLIWFLEWIAGAKYFPTEIANLVPDLAILAIATGLGAFAAHEFRPRRTQATVSYPLFTIHAGEGASLGGTKLTAKRDVVAASVKKSGEMIGCVILGDLQATFNTPMGMISASLVGPVTSAQIPFKGEKLDDDEAARITGKPRAELLEDARKSASLLDVVGREGSADFPFLHIEDGGSDNIVEVGPIKIQDGRGGEHVKIGPLTIDSDDSRGDERSWIARGTGDTYLRSYGQRISAKWNGSSLSLEPNSMKLQSGSDSFSYTPAEITTASPLHTMRVTQDKVSLDTRKFTLKVGGDTVVLRTEAKTRTTESQELAGDLRTLLTEAAKKQVREVMEGVPIDLSEMLIATEEVLARHG